MEILRPLKNNETIIKINSPLNKVFINAFILEHKLYGVWMLCKECHKKLG